MKNFLKDNWRWVALWVVVFLVVFVAGLFYLTGDVGSEFAP